MKKILFVIDSLTSGGAEKSLISLLSLLNYKEYSVDLLMFSPKGLYFPLVPKEVNIIQPPEFIVRQMDGVKLLLRKMRYKDLMIRVGTSFSMRNPLLRKRLHGAQITWNWFKKGMEPLPAAYDVAIAYSQGLPTYFVAEKVSAKKKYSWLNIDYRKAGYNKHFDIEYYRKFNKVIAVSDIGKDILVKEIPELEHKIEVVYDIISPRLIKQMSNEGEGFPDDYRGLRILTIGRLVPQKGYDITIETCRKLKESGFDFRWYIIGEGELRENLEKEASEQGVEKNIIFLGTFQNPYTYLKQCDLYVQSSRYEGYGLAIAEARILQKPIVSTNFEVIHNQIIDGVNGLIVNMNSHDLFLGIKRIIEENDLRHQICENLLIDKVGTEEELSKIYALLESS